MEKRHVAFIGRDYSINDRQTDRQTDRQADSCDVFLYPYCLLLCTNIVIMDCTHLYLASALGVFYGGHARCDVFLYSYCLLLCINIVIMDCTHLYLASALGVFYGGHARCDVHPCYPGDRQCSVFCFLVVIVK